MPRLPLLFALSLAVSSSAAAQKPAVAAHDTVDAKTYTGWQQYSLVCARCHGDDGLGTSFGPNLVTALRPEGSVPNRDAFKALLLAGRPDKGMPSGATLGLAPEHFDAVYDYLSGRSSGRLHGGRPVRRGS